MGYVLGEVRWKMRQVNSEHWHILYVLLHIHSQCPQVGPNEAGSVCRFVTCVFFGAFAITIYNYNQYFNDASVSNRTCRELSPASALQTQLYYTTTLVASFSTAGGRFVLGFFKQKSSKDPLSATCSGPNGRQTQLATSWWAFQLAAKEPDISPDERVATQNRAVNIELHSSGGQKQDSKLIMIFLCKCWMCK